LLRRARRVAFCENIRKNFRRRHFSAAATGGGVVTEIALMAIQKSRCLKLKVGLSHSIV